MPRPKELDSLLADIEKKYGLEDSDKPIIGRAVDFPPVRFIPTSSPFLGYVLASGGWPEGRLIEFFGKESVGKTSMMYMGMLDCWNFYERQRAIALIDVEHRYNPEWAEKLGVPLDDLIVSQPKDAEDAVDISAKLIKSGQVCALGFDSIGAAMGEKLHRTFVDQPAVMAGTASVMSRWVGQVAPLANLNNCTVFATNQLRADMEGWNRPLTPGGHKVKHMMSIRLYLSVSSKKDLRFYSKDYSEEGEEVGHTVNFKTVKNSFGPFPREGASDFFFRPSSEHLDHVGFDTRQDIQRLGILSRVIQRRGPYYSWEGIQGQGRDAFFEELRKSGRESELHDAILKRLDEGITITPDEEEFKKPDGPVIDDPEI